MIPDKEWEEFVATWKEKWPMTTPHRLSVEGYLDWKAEKYKAVDYKWKKEGM